MLTPSVQKKLLARIGMEGISARLPSGAAGFAARQVGERVAVRAAAAVVPVLGTAVSAVLLTGDVIAARRWLRGKDRY